MFLFLQVIYNLLVTFFSWLSQGFSDNGNMCSSYVNPSLSSCVHSDVHVIHVTQSPVLP